MTTTSILTHLLCFAGGLLAGMMAAVLVCAGSHPPIPSKDSLGGRE